MHGLVRTAGGYRRNGNLLFPELDEALPVGRTAGRQLGAAEERHAPVAGQAARLDDLVEALPGRLPVGECIEGGQYPLQRLVRRNRQRRLAVRIVESGCGWNRVRSGD